jgi:putative membrane protein
MPHAKVGFIVAIALVIVAPIGVAQETKESPPPLGTASFIPPESKKHEPLTPENFVVRAAIINLSEIEAAEQALDKSSNPEIRNFATQILRDHRSAQAKLKAVAAEAKIALPGTVDEETRKQNQQLSELVAVDFDRRFIELMHSGHSRALDLFKQARGANLPPAFKRYSNDTAKVVDSHRTQLEKLKTD